MNARLGIVIVVMLGLNLASLTVESLNNAASGIISAVSGSGTLYNQARSVAVEAESALQDQMTSAAELQASADSMTAESDTLKAEIAGLSSENEALKASADAHMAETGRLSDELDKSIAMVAEKSAELVEMMKPVTVDLAGETLTVTEAVLATSRRISQRTADAVSRNLDSMSAQGIPFVGVDAVIGSAAADVDNSCENLKDLNALNRALNPDGEEDANTAAVCDASVPSRDDIWAQIKDSPAAAWESAKAAMPEMALPEYEMPDVWEWAISKF